MPNFMQKVGEQLSDLTRALWPWTTMSTIRGYWGGMKLGLKFWPTMPPKGQGSEVNYEMLRSLYRNDGENNLGASFAKPIVNLQTAFIGLPTVSTESEATDDYLNDCIMVYWTDEIQQMLRDSMRDSKCIVRMSRPDVFDPLMTLEEAEHCSIEILPPERVDIERNAGNKRIIERAVIHHRMVFVTDDGSIERGRDPINEEHDVIEIITRQDYRFFDQTTDEWLDGLARGNRHGFVPLLEVHNEWDSALQGGQSELETVIPFINAFHDVLTQGLQAHQYHSTPKIKMKLADILPFVKNNYPEAIDPATGAIRPQGEISFHGREIFFLQTDDDIEFLEANSVLGDTRVLLEFLIDCISIASETPEWALMRVDSGSANSDRNAQTVPFIKKVERKRRNFQKPIQELCKMALVMSGVIPVRPKVSWEIIRADDQIVFMQAFQQLVMGLEVAAERGEISDQTYRRMMKEFLPLMKSSSAEARDAERDQAKRERQQIRFQQALPAPQNGNSSGRTPVAGPGEQ